MSISAEPLVSYLRQLQAMGQTHVSVDDDARLILREFYMRARAGNAAGVGKEAQSLPVRQPESKSEVVGPKFKVYLESLGNDEESMKMIDFHERYITSFAKDLLDEAILKKEISKIDTQAFAMLLGGIGRDFAKDENIKKLSRSPEESANSITEIILNGISRENKNG